MPSRMTPPLVGMTAAVLLTGGIALAVADPPKPAAPPDAVAEAQAPRGAPAPRPGPQQTGAAPPDAVAEAQSQRGAPATRPEQQKTEHDRTVGEAAKNPLPASPVFKNQP